MAQVYNLMQMDVRTGTKEIITAVQFDSASRFLDVILTDNGVAVDLTNHEVRLFANKADGTEYYADGEITAATTGRCQFELTDQMLAVAQDIEVQIITYYDNVEVLQAPVFKIHVVKSLITDSAIESSNEYGALVVLYQNLYEAYDLMTTILQNIGVPSEIAEGLSIETMWEALEWMVDYTGNDLTELITNDFTELTELINNALANASVQGVLDVIGTASDTSDSTVMGKLNNAQYECVKSVQWGVFSPSETSDAKRTLSTVNPDKCLVLIHNKILGVSDTSGTEYVYGSYVSSLTATQLSLSLNYSTAGFNSYGTIYWQVIEFY